MEKRVFILGLLVMLVSIGQISFAAQSSADGVVDSATKEELRKEIVGEQNLPGEEQEYIIGHGDILSVSIYGEGDMAASAALTTQRAPRLGAEGQPEGGGGAVIRRPGNGVEVRMDGRISLLHIGDVRVAGMTLLQLADYLKKLYSSIYENPTVTTVLTQSNSRRYTVMGQVMTPGIFHLDFPITLVQALARSGGFNEWAKKSDITVVRQGNNLLGPDKKKSDKDTMKFDYSAFLKGDDLGDNIYIKAGDIIIIN
jgi:polysaccharide export outer membrane protein